MLTSSESMVYRTDSGPSQELNNLCSTRQPVLFRHDMTNITGLGARASLSNVELETNHSSSGSLLTPLGTLVTDHKTSATSPLKRLDHCYRHYLICLKDDLHVTLWTPGSCEKARWDVIDEKHHRLCTSADIEGEKLTSMRLAVGEGLFVPSGWGYRVESGTDKERNVLHLYYYTVMNRVANLRFRIPRSFPERGSYNIHGLMYGKQASVNENRAGSQERAYQSWRQRPKAGRKPPRVVTVGQLLRFGSGCR